MTWPLIILCLLLAPIAIGMLIHAGSETWPEYELDELRGDGVGE